MTIVKFETITMETLVIEQLDDDVLVLRINRPDRMNSMTLRSFYDLTDAARLLREAAPRALIITGAGDRAFCAGFDLAELHVIGEMGVREFFHFEELAANAMADLRALPFAVIAAINGPAAGGGLSLALIADIRIGTPTAKLGAAFVKVGLSGAELGTSWMLTRLIGPGRAAELVFTARNVGAEEALEIGLLNRIVPADRLMDEALELAHSIAANSPSGIRLSKSALRFNQEIGSYAAAMELENRGQALLTRTADMPEALTAFLEKRPPVFTGQ